MTSAVRPFITTPDLDRLLGFYTGLLGAVETSREPAEGPAFFVGLRYDDSEFGLVADAEVDLTAPQRTMMSIAVPDVDDVLTRVVGLGGTVSGPPNDMPWGERVAHITDPDGNAVNLTHTI